MNLINGRYQDLCKELGHLSSNAIKLDRRIKEIEAEIAALDSLQAYIKQQAIRQAEEQANGEKQD